MGNRFTRLKDQQVIAGHEGVRHRKAVAVEPMTCPLNRSGASTSAAWSRHQKLRARRRRLAGEQQLIDVVLKAGPRKWTRSVLEAIMFRQIQLGGFRTVTPGG
jgi:hypothetical protein